MECAIRVVSWSSGRRLAQYMSSEAKASLMKSRSRWAVLVETRKFWFLR